MRTFLVVVLRCYFLKTSLPMWGSKTEGEALALKRQQPHLTYYWLCRPYTIVPIGDSFGAAHPHAYRATVGLK